MISFSNGANDNYAERMGKLRKEYQLGMTEEEAEHMRPYRQFVHDYYSDDCECQGTPTADQVDAMLKRHR